MTYWSSREIEPLTLRLSRMPATGGSGDNADTSTSRSSDSVSRQIYVHPDKFYGYPNDDCLDWFASFERIARANEWDDAKCGRMISKHFILGLRPELMRRVTMADPKTFSDAIRVALREESLEESFAPQRVSSVEPQNDQMTQVIGLLTKLLEKKDNPGNLRSNFRRNNRYETFRNRTKPNFNRPIYNFCEKPGHIESRCWKKFPNLRSGSDCDKNQGN